VIAGASLALGLLVGLYCYRKVGGYTGDTLGATVELVECVPALIGSLLLV
jgi:adenosylcobinamide-GDP ribazoletransferase